MRILVLTETDACCGPMAAAFLRDYSTSLEVVSAGRKPLRNVDTLMVDAMKESLIDLSDYQPKDVSTMDVSSFDVVYEFPELPSSKTIDGFRELRDYIKNETYLFFRGLNSMAATQ